VCTSCVYMCACVSAICSPDPAHAPHAHERRPHRVSFSLSLSLTHTDPHNGWHNNSRAPCAVEEFIYLYSDNTVEGPRAPAVKLTVHHSNLTRVS
jgi:hypothetical protein